MSKLKLYWNLVAGWLTPGTSGFERAFDYVIDCVNTWLCTEDVASHVVKTRDFLASALTVMTWLSGMCPESWRNYIAPLLAVVSRLVSILSDGKFTTDEMKELVVQFKVSYAEWRSE